jgi:hypothetical protein
MGEQHPAASRQDIELPPSEDDIGPPGERPGADTVGRGGGWLADMHANIAQVMLESPLHLGLDRLRQRRAPPAQHPVDSRGDPVREEVSQGTIAEGAL